MSVPRLFRRMVDDASVLPPGGALPRQAVDEHRAHRAAWYGDLVGTLLVPAADLDDLRGVPDPADPLAIGLVGELPVVRARLAKWARGVPAGLDGADLAQIEVPVAKRGEDPIPGLTALLELARAWPTLPVYAEIPLTWGLSNALDVVAEARAAGVLVAAKFRTGGLAAELFPTPVELAAVICACHERDLPFKLTSGLHHAIRHGDPDTGLTHHGFLNVLVGALIAADGGEVVDVAQVLGNTDPVPLIEAVRPRRHDERPLWIGFSSTIVDDPVRDLGRLSLIHPVVPS
ncbi:hypothetical protein GCM10009681_26990 [Luedemannella helvata]|uniref:Uncharacterized protein n=2 Tax=Luedemannella helvata TaxID=349315 RepID=A0ABN2KF01_9ACTN